MSSQYPEPYLVAVASKDGISVNLHFGHAKHFMIYRVEAGAYHYVESRDVDNYCLGGSGDMQAFEKILMTLHDCAVCLVAKIGDGPKEKLAKAGIIADDNYAYEGVSEAMAGLIQASVPA